MPKLDKLINLEQLQIVSKNKQKQITANANAIAGIKDGTVLDSFSDVELALMNKLGSAELVTYAELTSLKNGSHLIPNQYYRITDYVTTTSQAGTQSAGHQFDIIVLALSNNKLSEDAYADKHEGDTYFVNNDLTKWKLKYCLENDTTRFDWADTTNGKGVIFRLIDENLNDLPYDFKNIQFARYKITAINDNNYNAFVGKYFGFSGALGTTIDSTDYKYYYTFNRVENGEIVENYDLSIQNTLNPSYELSKYVKQVTIKEYLNDSPNYRGIKGLNNFVFASGNIIVDISFGYNSHHNTIITTNDYTYNYYGSMFRNNLIWVGNKNHNNARECFESNLVLCPDSSKSFSWNTFNDHFSGNYCQVIKHSNFKAENTKFPNSSEFISVFTIINSDFTGTNVMEVVEGIFWQNVKCNSGSISHINIMRVLNSNFKGLTTFNFCSGDCWQNVDTENVNTLSNLNFSRLNHITIKNRGLARSNGSILQYITLESQEINTTALYNVNFNAIVQTSSSPARILYDTSSFTIPYSAPNKTFNKVQYIDANEQVVTLFTIAWQEYDGANFITKKYYSTDLGLTWELDDTYYNELFLSDAEMETLISEVFE